MEEFIIKELDFKDVMILPQKSYLSSCEQVKLERSFEFVNILDEDNSDDEDYEDKKIYKNWYGIPIIASNMDTTGTFKVYNCLKKYKILTALNKFYTVQDYINANNSGIELDPNYFMVTTGITDENFKNLKEIILYTKCKWICIDVANGYMDCFVNFCKKIRLLYPDKIIVAGNVVTGEMATELITKGGVDVIKIGIGFGNDYLTKRQTGVGRPQLQSIKECVDVCKKLRTVGYSVYTISDGGIKYPGDMAKAFGIGADFVMLGEVFAGHDENPGDIIEESGERFKILYDMTSKYSIETYFNKIDNYRSSQGNVIKVPYKGPLENTIQDFLGGLRSTCTYIGAYCIEEIPDKTYFIIV